jgi:hypothetical protein
MKQGQIVIAGAIAAAAAIVVAYFAESTGASLQYPADVAATGSEKKIDGLTEAFEQGKITAAQYRAQVAVLAHASVGEANLRAQPASSAPHVPDSNAAAKFDALNSALDTGLITRSEYNAKVAALTAVPPSGAARRRP